MDFKTNAPSLDASRQAIALYIGTSNPALAPHKHSCFSGNEGGSIEVDDIKSAEVCAKLKAMPPRTFDLVGSDWLDAIDGLLSANRGDLTEIILGVGLPSRLADSFPLPFDCAELFIHTKDGLWLVYAFHERSEVDQLLKLAKRLSWREMTPQEPH